MRAVAASDGWSLGPPDLILQFADPYCMTDDERDTYVNIPVQITADMLPEHRWLSSIEYRNGPAVHHIISGVGGLVLGAEPRAYEQGYERVMRAGPRQVMFNMHFNKEPGSGTALCTNIQAGVRFKPEGEVIMAAQNEITYPDGRHKTLLHVPEYDFNWQHTYRFAKPVLAPAGSVLRFTLWWDNSENNPHNPDPTSPSAGGCRRTTRCRRAP